MVSKGRRSALTVRFTEPERVMRRAASLPSSVRRLLLCALLRHGRGSSALLLRRAPLQAEHHGWSFALSSSAGERAHCRLL
ncbi:hypothetical protein QQF64_020703 [Cirrhinus molitorella]|uniref:Uncharacterized protein n=1 Tax=Cirrhinus molitorella TaxID=172907 RepID=A0ABR3LA32_9TELE